MPYLKGKNIRSSWAYYIQSIKEVGKHQEKHYFMTDIIFLYIFTMLLSKTVVQNILSEMYRKKSKGYKVRRERSQKVLKIKAGGAFDTVEN